MTATEFTIRLLKALGLRIRLEELQNCDRIAVKINGTPLDATGKKPRWLTADVPADAIVPGCNTLEVCFEDGEQEPLTMTAVELTVRYTGKSA